MCGAPAVRTGQLAGGRPVVHVGAAADEELLLDVADPGKVNRLPQPCARRETGTTSPLTATGPATSGSWR